MYNNELFHLTAGLCAAKKKKRDAFHPLPGGFADVDRPKMCVCRLPSALPTPPKQQRGWLTHSDKLCFRQQWSILLLYLSSGGSGKGFCLGARAKRPAKEEEGDGRRPFIHVSTRRWFCRGCVLCKQWLTILSTHSLEYCIYEWPSLGGVRKLSLALSLSLFLFLRGAAKRFVMCYAGELGADRESQCQKK